MKKKVTYKNELEFVNEVADDCIKHLRKHDKEYLISNPYALDYHFSYCLYIRNHYIHNRDFSNASFWVESDHLSSEIIRMIFSKLLPEYDYKNPFIKSLYDTKQFIKLRKEYKNIYGEYPVFLLEKYKTQVKTEPEHSMSEMQSWSEDKIDAEIKIRDANYEIIFTAIDQLIHELAELVWQTGSLKETAEKCGIDYNSISENVNSIKNIFFSEGEFIPLQVCLLPYRQKIGHKRYIEYRRLLTKQLINNPRLIEKLDISYFNDRVLARSALKYGWVLRYLPMYQNDEKMVRLSLTHDGTAIEYADKRFQQDREWVKYAIEHSKNGTIMFLNCMKPYRKDKELVYLACRIKRYNFAYVDKSFQNDFDLAKICLQQTEDPNTIFEYLSKRLKGNKELAMLDLEEDYPNTEYYSSKLRNDDEIAAKLYELHGTKSWAWDHMSKRLRKKYRIEDD